MDHPTLNNPHPYPIVGIGASAGGLDAIGTLLNHLPSDLGLSLVILQHLDPNQPRAMDDALSRFTSLPIQVATEGLEVAPNQVYVIPPDQAITLKSGCLRLRPRSPGVNRVIDIFFESLADERKNTAIGIVLSGHGNDGAQGLRAIKAAGGITMAQSVSSAEYESMPEQAIATGAVDFVQPPAQLAETLVNVSRHPYVSDANPDQWVRPSVDEQSLLSDIFKIVYERTRVNFSDYKPTTIRRRIARRMTVHHLEELGQYLHYLKQHPQEAEVLYEEMLINVSHFFRDPEVFEALRQTIFPTLLQNRDRLDPLRIWVAGCANGEEAYSIGICLLEYIAEEAPGQLIQIFATDLSEAAIDRARQGIYLPTQMENISANRRQRFFVPVEEGYQINAAVREVCIFAQQNLAADPPFSRLDLLSCRNVLIYFSGSLQSKLFSLFHYSLKPNGFLMLGSSESVGDFSDLFRLADRKHKLYVKQSTELPLRLNFGEDNYRMPDRQAFGTSSPPGRRDEPRLDKAVNEVLLQHYAPTGVVVNANLDILQFRGQTGAYLEPTPGQASLNLLSMIREPLQVDLRTVLYQVQQSGEPTHLKTPPISYRDRYYRVRIDVTPFRLQDTESYYLVLFTEVPPDPVVNVASDDPNESDRSADNATVRRYRRQIEQLQNDLAATRSHLQSIIKEREYANQDLRAANEEILSSNEELQSTNEELQTAKEEIQATNEELGTINDELYRRNAEGIHINNDFQNLLSSINIPILMVNRELNIRRFTRSTANLFNLIPGDMGRPLSDINHRLAIDNLEQRILDVIASLNMLSEEIQDQDGQWYELQIRPYRTVDHRIDGAVIVLIDIDRLKRNGDELRSAREFADSIVQTVRQSLVVLDDQLHVIMANQQFYQLFQVSPSETEHRSIFELGNGQWNSPKLRTLLLDVLPDDHRIENFEITHDFETIGHKTMILNACRLLQPGKSARIVLSIEEICEENRNES